MFTYFCQGMCLNNGHFLGQCMKAILKEINKKYIMTLDETRVNLNDCINKMLSKMNRKNCAMFRQSKESFSK